MLLFILTLTGGVLLALGLLGVFPTLSVFQRMFVLLGADTTTFNKSVGNLNKVILIISEFNPAQFPDLVDLTEATFDGYAPREIAVDARQQSNDPATMDSLLDLPASTDPYLWETTGVTNLPQTVFGFAIVDSGGTVMLGCDLMPNGPVVLSGVNQSVALSRVVLRQLLGSVT